MATVLSVLLRPWKPRPFLYSPKYSQVQALDFYPDLWKQRKITKWKRTNLMLPILFLKSRSHDPPWETCTGPFSLDVPTWHAFSIVLITCNQTLLASLGLNGRKNKIFMLNTWHYQCQRDAKVLHYKVTKLFENVYNFFKLLVFMNLISKIEFWCFHWANWHVFSKAKADFY